jgi:hypothetical protein
VRLLLVLVWSRLTTMKAITYDVTHQAAFATEVL